MSDYTSGSGQHAHRAPRAEFYIYFALIFAVAIPFALIAWVAHVAVNRSLPVHGPLARAWREAGTITPNIFRP